MGLVYVFLFLNVKDGPSRFRMASFYAVCMQYFGENGRLNVVPPPDLMFCAQQRVPDTNRGRLRTQQIVCIVMLAPASSANGDVKLSADD